MMREKTEHLYKCILYHYFKIMALHGELSRQLPRSYFYDYVAGKVKRKSKTVAKLILKYQDDPFFRREVRHMTDDDL